MGAHALEAADDGNDGGEDRRLADADQVGGDTDRLGKAVQEFAVRHPELGPGHDHAAEYAQQVGKHREQGQGDHQRDHLGQDQQLQRRDADGAHGIDLLGHGHGANLRRIGGAGTSGDDDRGHQRCEFAQHRQTDQISHKDVGAVASQLVGRLVGHDHAEQERQQANDRQCVKAGAADVEQDWSPAQPFRVRQTRSQDQRGLSHKREQGGGLFTGGKHRAADAFERHEAHLGRRWPRVGRCPGLVGHRVQQPHKPGAQAVHCHHCAVRAQAQHQGLQ